MTTEHVPEASARGTYAQAVASLSRAQKSNRGAPAYSRFVNRPLGRRLAAAAYVAGMRPNQVTALSALVTFSGIALIAVGTPRPWLGLAVGGLLVLGYGLDAADGQLARLRGGGSAQGEWLDHVVDCVKNASIHLAVLVSWYRQDEPSGLLLVPLAFSLCASTWFFALLLTEKLRPASAGSNKTDPDVERPPLLRSLVVLPADYGLLCVVFVLIGWPAVFTPVYVLLAAANLLLLAAGLRRWFVELTPAKALS